MGPKTSQGHVVCLALSTWSAHSLLLGCYVTLACVLGGFSICDLVAGDVLDLIASLNHTDAEAAGFRYIPGPDNGTPAILLQDSRRHVAVPEATSREAVRLWENHEEITFLATIRQDMGDSGSIISLTSPLYRLLELESSGRKDEVRFHYTQDQHARVETFPYRLADGRWHRLALTLNGGRLSLALNCSTVYSRLLRQPLDRTWPAQHLQQAKLFLGQRNEQHALFRGALQDVKIVTHAHGYLLQCPQQNTDCPTCPHYQALENRVQEMIQMYKNLSEKLQRAEERISHLERCQCRHTCYHSGTVRAEGEMWRRGLCSQCMCRNGTVVCSDVQCPPSQCTNAVQNDGECCPTCLNDCVYQGVRYDHGVSISPRVCVTCTCDNGQMKCERRDPDATCPKLNCPESQKLHVEGQCCPVCKGTNFCALGNDCHRNATCVNWVTQFACQCNQGFQGDGRHCQDIDECATEGGKFGHHCLSNTVCVNTPGSYLCQCREGHVRQDDFACERSQESKESAPHSPACSLHCPARGLPGLGCVHLLTWSLLLVWVAVRSVS